MWLLKKNLLMLLTLIPLYFGALLLLESGRGNKPIKWRYEVTSNSVNVRSEPNTSSKVLKKMKRGDRFVGGSSSSGWVQIVQESQECWVSYDLLKKVGCEEREKHTMKEKMQYAISHALCFPISILFLMMYLFMLSFYGRFDFSPEWHTGRAYEKGTEESNSFVHRMYFTFLMVVVSLAVLYLAMNMDGVLSFWSEVDEYSFRWWHVCLAIIAIIAYLVGHTKSYIFLYSECLEEDNDDAIIYYLGGGLALLTGVVYLILDKWFGGVYLKETLIIGAVVQMVYICALFWISAMTKALYLYIGVGFALLSSIAYFFFAGWSDGVYLKEMFIVVGVVQLVLLCVTYLDLLRYKESKGYFYDILRSLTYVVVYAVTTAAFVLVMSIVCFYVIWITIVILVGVAVVIVVGTASLFGSLAGAGGSGSGKGDNKKEIPESTPGGCRYYLDGGYCRRGDTRSKCPSLGARGSNCPFLGMGEKSL